MQIIEITEHNAAQVGALVADFRVTLKSYKGIDVKPNIAAGKEEINLVEIHKPYNGEKLTQTIKVGEHEFDF